MNFKRLIIFCIIIAPINYAFAQTFDNFKSALATPEKVVVLTIESSDQQMKHLPAGLGTLVNLKELRISCLETLEDLPDEIGKLRQLEKLIIDNGNGCSMNISFPVAIGNLRNLKILRLYGALDSREVGPKRTISNPRGGGLPSTIAKLQNLEELDLGRNGIDRIPNQVGELLNLRKLSLDYNEIHEIPDFIGNLKKLQELSILGMGGVKLPESLRSFKKLKISMGNNCLKLKAQDELRKLFPKVEFDFRNIFYDAAANE
jgi:leucine-rich repeat protein SHOC2